MSMYNKYLDKLAEENTESRKRLIKTSKILNESDNLRTDEEQNAHYWLMYAIDYGLDEAVDRFCDEIEIQNNE